MPDSRPALGTLYDGAAPAVFGFLLRMVRDRAWAEDLLQESFLRVAPHLGALESVEAARSYLWRTASNLALDGLRRKGRHAPLDLDARPEPSDPCATDGLRAAEANEDRARLHAEVEALPPRERAAVLLRVTAHLAFREVGEALGITDRGAAHLYEGGIARLKARLSPRDPDETEGPRRRTHASHGR